MTKNNFLICCIAGFAALVTAQAGFSANACWLDSYGRGVGTVPGRVADCPKGYTNMGLTCTSGLTTYSNPSIVASCPSGYTNFGLFCKGTTWSTAFSFKTSGEMTCPPDYFLNAEIGRCYKNCKPGFKSVGEICAEGLDTLGSSAMTCNADEVKGGVSNARCYPKVGDCGADGEKDAGLCYKKCAIGYKGVGPVCWGSCPSSLPYSCGAACAKDAAGCGTVIYAQVSSVATVAATIASFGTATAVTAAATAPEKAAQVSALRAQYDSMVAAFNAVKNLPAVQTSIQNAQNAGKLVGGIKTVSSGVVELTNSENLTEADIIRVAAQIAAIVDTTGISATVAAYSLPLCSTQFNELPKPPADAPPAKPPLTETTVPSHTEMPGFCYPDPANPSWYILKTENKAGWGPGDNCHATDGTITPYGQKPCKGGSLASCQEAAKSL
jgi:hypothetical protein